MNHHAKPASLLLLAILLGGCSTLADFIPPVHILKPLWGDHIDAGRAYQLWAMIRSDYPIELVEVRLWDVNSNYEVTWRVDNPARSSTLSLDMRLDIPSTAPADDDYRLDVTAYPGKEASRNMYCASGYSVRLAIDNPRWGSRGPAGRSFLWDRRRIPESLVVSSLQGNGRSPQYRALRA